MHDEAYRWVAEHAVTEPSVLDIGGRNVNGTVRELFATSDYTALDILAGPGVDIVADASTWQPSRTYDVVVCCETFEHTPSWPAICRTAYAATAPAGRFIVTTAAPGRPEHSAIDGGPLQPGEYYGNVEPEDLRAALVAAGFTEVVIDVQTFPSDVRATATRPLAQESV